MEMRQLTHDTTSCSQERAHKRNVVPQVRERPRTPSYQGPYLRQVSLPSPLLRDRCTVSFNSCWETSLSECGLGNFFIFGVWVGLCCGFLCRFGFLLIFSVTVPGTNAPRSVVTRGKPSLFSFSCFQGSLRPRFLALHLDYL